MERRCDVLLFGSMGTIAADVQEILSAHGLEVHSAAFPQNVFKDESGYRRALVAAVTACTPKVVLPIGNTVAMSRFKDLVGRKVPLREIVNSRKITFEAEDAVAGAAFVIEREEVVGLLDSKVRTARLAAELGIPQPRIYSDLAEIDPSRQVVFKRDISFGGHGVHLPWTMEALQKLIDHQSLGEPYLVEEYVDGADYSLDMLRFADGTMQSGGYLCIKPKGNGPALERNVLPEEDKVLEKMRSSAATILEHLDYHGICGFDFRVNGAGEALLLECNPRFTGGVASQAAAGFEIPYQLYLEAVGARQRQL